MAFGFPPKYEETVSFNNIAPGDWKFVTIEAFKRLNWEIVLATEWQLEAKTASPVQPTGEKIIISQDGNDTTICSESLGARFFDQGRNEENIRSFIDACNSVLEQTSDDAMNRYRSDSAKLFEKDPGSETQTAPNDSKADMLTLFTFRAGYILTPLVIYINIVIFALMAFSGAGLLNPSTSSLISWGANIRPLTLNGEWWRLLTSCFVHIGVLHLAMNLYAFFVIGILLEPIIGRSRLTLAYLATGIAGSVASILIHEATVSAGASGAIFGLYGVFLALLTTNFIAREIRRDLLKNIGIFVVFNLVYGLKGGIDNAAHVGGLAAGLLLGYSFYFGLRKEASAVMKLAVPAMAMMILAGCSIIPLRSMSEVIASYDRLIHSVFIIEKDALESVQTVDVSSSEAVRWRAYHKGALRWRRALSVMDSIDVLDLPEGMRRRTQLVRRYCELRCREFELMAERPQSDTDPRSLEVEQIEAQLREVADDLKGPQGNGR